MCYLSYGQYVVSDWVESYVCYVYDHRSIYIASWYLVVLCWIYMDTCLPVVCPDTLFACNVLGKLKGYRYEGGVTTC